MRKLWLLPVAIGTAFIVILALKTIADRHGAAPKIPIGTQRDLDSLHMTQPAHEARVDSLLARVRVDSITRVQLDQRAARYHAQADAIRHVADSLAAVAQTADEWKAAHDQRQAEARQWEQVATAKDSALRVEIGAHALTSQALTDERTRRKHLEAITIPGLERAIARLEQPCRIGFIPCPTRTVIGVLGAVGGYVLGQYMPLPSSNSLQTVPYDLKIPTRPLVSDGRESRTLTPIRDAPQGR